MADKPGLKEALQDSMEPTKVLVHSLFSRLSLKDKPMLSYSSASEHEIEAFFDVLHGIAPNLSRGDTTKKSLQKLPTLKEFIAHCCYQRKYVFGVKKCGVVECDICTPPRLPESVFQELYHIPDPIPGDDQQHYKPFSSVYGTLTTEKDRPSSKKEGEKGHGIPLLKQHDLLSYAVSVYGPESYILSENLVTLKAVQFHELSKKFCTPVVPH